MRSRAIPSSPSPGRSAGRPRRSGWRGVERGPDPTLDCRTMNDDRWDAVDALTNGLLQPADPVLEAAIKESAALPNIAVSPAQGQFLHLLARAIHARRILEIGTLGGYSAIWMGRALPDGGRLISLELDESHAEVHRPTNEPAGLDGT